MKLNRPLIFHIKDGRNDLAKQIIKNNNLYRQIDTYNCVLLHYSCKFGNDEITKYLIDGGCNINAQDGLGWTPLMKSLYGQHENVTQILLNAGADVLIMDYENKSTLHYLFERFERNSHIIELFLNQFKKQFCGSEEEITRRIVDAGIRIDQAIVFEDISIIEYMLKKGLSANYVQTFYPYYTILHLAVKSLNVEAVKLLLKYGADVNVTNAHGSYPIDYLYCNFKDRNNLDNIEILNALLEAGATVMSTSQAKGTFQITFILIYGPREAICLLLESGRLDFEAKDAYCQSSLMHYFAINCNDGIADELKNHGVKFDKNVADNLGRSPLYTAAKFCNIKMLEYLLNIGAEIHSTPKCNKVPPIAAAYINKPKLEHLSDQCIELILQRSTDNQFVYGSDKEQYTIFDFKMTEINNCRVNRLKPVVAKLALMEKRGTKIINIIKSKISSQKSFKEYFEQCQRILNKKINKKNKYVTLFSLLTSNEKTLRRYLSERDLVTKLMRISHSQELKSRYSFFYNTLKKRLTKAFLYKILNSKASSVISRLLEYRFDESNIITENIIDYLNEKDLRELFQV